VSLRQKVVLELEDGTTVPVTFDGRDLRAWEAKHHRSSIIEPMSVGMLTWLGWSAARRSGALNGSFDTYDKFDAVCVGVEGASEDEPADESADGEEKESEDPPTTAGTRATRKKASAS
jgi:hypothetical protein